MLIGSVAMLGCLGEGLLPQRDHYLALALLPVRGKGADPPGHREPGRLGVGGQSHTGAGHLKHTTGHDT